MKLRRRQMLAATAATIAAPSRARAQGGIRAGLVLIDGAVVDKPSTDVAADAVIEIAGDVHDYVSRGALKLEAALRAFAVDPAGRICLDLGASTGGFAEVLLRAGAAKVFAVDVGSGQLHPAISGDERVVNLERTHAKDLSAALIPDLVEIIVCDVSFISLKKALPFAMAFAVVVGGSATSTFGKTADYVHHAVVAVTTQYRPMRALRWVA